MLWNTFTVVGANDWLSAVQAVVVVLQHPGTVEIWVNLL